MTISDRKVVAIDYTLKNTAGDVVDTSKGRTPLSYLHGANNIIPGLEQALTGKSKGDTVQISVPPEQGYGVRDEKLIANVPRSSFAGVDKIEPGMTFRADSNQGSRLVRIVKVDATTITIDANHPLAGETLNFDVEVMEIRDATEEEVAHGHPHGPGGHQH